MSPFDNLGVAGLFCCFYSIFNGKILSANTVDPDQTQHYVASGLCLHCLPMTFLKRQGVETDTQTLVIIIQRLVFELHTVDRQDRNNI